MTLLFFLAYLNPFISFSCYIVPAWTWNTVLNWSSNNGHLCFVLNPTGNAFSVNRYFVDTFIRLRKFPSNPSMLRGFFFFFFSNDVEFYQKVFRSFWHSPNYFPFSVNGTSYIKYINWYFNVKTIWHLWIIILL